MINLIPNEEKKKMSKDFAFRLASFSFFMLGISALVWVITIFPSYFISATQARSVAAKIDSREREEASADSDKDSLARIQALRDKISLVEEGKKNGSFFSETILNQLSAKKTEGIKITGISYGRGEGRGPAVGVAGTAESREALNGFHRALENTESFEGVNLPVSNFVQGSDIDFYLTITIRSGAESPAEQS